jgi:WD repeat-containing protein 44
MRMKDRSGVCGKACCIRCIIRFHAENRFSPDGHLLATGGQDGLLKIWAFKSAKLWFANRSQTDSNASKQESEILAKRFEEFQRSYRIEQVPPTINGKLLITERQAPLYSKPFCELIGHQAAVLDVAWSKSLFLLSSSMDKTVRLWHLSRLECLCFFRHVDFVSAIAFHPRDDRYFVSASLDG